MYGSDDRKEMRTSAVTEFRNDGTHGSVSALCVYQVALSAGRTRSNDERDWSRHFRGKFRDRSTSSASNLV